MSPPFAAAFAEGDPTRLAQTCLAQLSAVEDATLGIILALFAGFFLYIGASDLIPESFHAHPKLLTTVMTLLGAALLYLAVRLIG